MHTKEWFLHSAEGVALFCRRWETSSPRGICLIAHGLGEHCGRYESLAHALCEAGFSVWTMDHRGHGKSGGIVCDCVCFRQFADDFHLLVQNSRRDNPRLPFFLIGHSLGGLIALLYAATTPQDLRGVAVSSPALALAHPPSPGKVFLIRLLAKIFPTAQVSNGVNPADLSHDPHVVAEYEKDPLVHRTLTARCAVALDNAMRESPALAAQLTIPCLIMQAGKDAVCSPDASSRFSQSIPGSSSVFRLYDNYFHELFNEIGKERVIQDLNVWMKGLLS